MGFDSQPNLGCPGIQKEKGPNCLQLCNELEFNLDMFQLMIGFPGSVSQAKCPLSFPAYMVNHKWPLDSGQSQQSIGTA